MNFPSPNNHGVETTLYVDIEHQQKIQRQRMQQKQQEPHQQEQHESQQQKVTFHQKEISHTETVETNNVQMRSDIDNMPLSGEELAQIRWFLKKNYHQQMPTPSQLDHARSTPSNARLTPSHLNHARSTPSQLNHARSMDTLESEYTEFAGTTHAWTVFADDPSKRATMCDRYVGTSIIIFQLFTYYVFAKEAIRNYKSSSVPVEISHQLCLAANLAPEENFTCEAMVTSNLDNVVAFFMLGIFLSADFLQAARTIRDAPFGTIASLFAVLAGIEVFCAFLAGTIAVSYKLHIGELTDAIEVGVGLLFIRELSSRAYAGLRYKKKKQYRQFFFVVFLVVLFGFVLDPTYESMFVRSDY